MQDDVEEDYELVRVSDELFRDFASLVKRVYGICPSDEEMLRRFHTDEWGASYLGYFAYCRKTGEPAAFYGILPCFVEYEGRRYLASQGSSAMTHPDHRYRNLFYRTAKKTYELAKEEGIAFSFAFPNPLSYRGFMKLGWSHNGNINSYHFLVPTIPLAFLGVRFKFFERLARGMIRWATSRWRVEYYPFPSSSVAADIVTPLRDDLSNRFKPESDTRMIVRLKTGTSVWISFSAGRLSIGDIDLRGDKRRELKRVLRTLRWICWLSGIFHLQTHLSPGCTLDLLLRDLGYVPRTNIPICHFDLSSTLPIDKVHYTYGDFDTF